MDELENTEKFLTKNTGAKFVLITSGGTSVKWDNVRGITNFSMGKRGAASAEVFLKAGYSVIFLYSRNSLYPFHWRVIKGSRVDRKNPEFSIILDLADRYESHLLHIEYFEVSEYLFYLEALSKLFSRHAPQSIFYLAAAVSDFKISDEQMSDTKVESSDSPPLLKLTHVEKMLKPVVKFWVPDAFVVTFKLETEWSKLIPKARKALEKYGHKLVIANELTTRSEKVIFVEPNIVSEILKEDVGDIEEKIVAEVIKKHEEYLKLGARASN